jgi:fibronectin type 3 domain-containing protein
VSFGDVAVGTTQTQPITMSATGSGVTVSSDASSNSQFVLNGASLPFTIAAGQSVSFNVTFTPNSSGTVSGSLSFTSDASNSQAVEPLTGTGTVQQHSVAISWNDSTDVAGYNVYRSTSANGTFAKINSTLDPSTAYTDSSVVSGTTYYYEATAVNSSGQESVRSTPPAVASVP